MGGVVRLVEPVRGGASDLPYFLTEAETRRHGVDIGGAVQSGILTEGDFRQMLAFCRECRDGGDLRRVPGHDRLAAATPDWCANRAVLEGLRGLV